MLNKVKSCFVLFFSVFISAIPLSVDAQGAKINTVVGILPIAYFVDRIGQDHVNIQVLVGPGQEPHTFEITSKTMAGLSKADMVFKLGFPFEESLIRKMKSLAPNTEIIDLQNGIDLIPMSADDHAKSHKGHRHSASEMDLHTWLNPNLAKIQAKTIAHALAAKDPQNKELYTANLLKLETDLDQIDRQLQQALEPLRGKRFYVFHPAYGYFGEAYGLKQVPVQIEGKEPTAKQIARLIDKAKKDGVQVIFVQPQFSKSSAQAIAQQINGVVIPLDDLSKDYLQNLKEMADKIIHALNK